MFKEMNKKELNDVNGGFLPPSFYYLEKLTPVIVKVATVLSR